MVSIGRQHGELVGPLAQWSLRDQLGGQRRGLGEPSAGGLLQQGGGELLDRGDAQFAQSGSVSLDQLGADVFEGLRAAPQCQRGTEIGAGGD